MYLTGLNVVNQQRRQMRTNSMECPYEMGENRRYVLLEAGIYTRWRVKLPSQRCTAREEER
jgi:hypothetical protein